MPISRLVAPLLALSFVSVACGQQHPKAGEPNGVSSGVDTTVTKAEPSGSAKGAPTAVKALDYTLRVEQVWDSLSVPWSICFLDASAQNALITEKRGTLRQVVEGKLLDAPVEGTPVVRDIGQGGLLDVAIDPDYATPGSEWVYLSFSDPLDKNNIKGPGMTRIVRAKIRDNKWVEEQTVWQARSEHYVGGGVHFGCRIVFDSQKRLYFAIGERGRKDDAQNLSRPNGKVHRINRDGTIPSDNPFVGKAGVYDSIFSFGNRNAQGLAFRPGTDDLWETEHGPRGGDELNFIRAGNNYGWPVISYGINYNGQVITEETHKDGMQQPVIQWTPSLAVCGLDFYSHDRMSKWKGDLLVGSLAFQELRRVRLDGNKAVSEELLLKQAGRIRDVVAGPDGAIYLVTNAPDRVRRLSPQ
jgi:aldose sugar dehydrogenase